ncbi:MULTISPECIES: helix-turn-helix domain-containing protein [Sphingobium]|uniref:helix-turn-helix domain-containing protein n=1 Tax=Sphingobium TaxID=165695 RepID=UPI000E76B616|nr:MULTISPECIES: helix-turn-helix domain-containing protein [Sphingobium]KAA9019280.1 hypothetical protein F4U94_03880 [Sphingobium limneticum]
MSFDALAWASKQQPGKMAAKMVLLCLANYANEDGEAYPSTAAIAAFGDMNHKTATTALDRLEEIQLISDTGRRQGKSGQIKVYRLHLERGPEKVASLKRKPPVSSTQADLKREVEASRKRVTDTVKEPIKDTLPQRAAISSEKIGARGTRLPDGWCPGPLPGSVAQLVAQWPAKREERELDSFRDFWRSAARNATKLDWDRTWHNRIRDVHDRVLRTTSAATAPQEYSNPLVRAAMRFEAEHLARELHDHQFHAGKSG